MRAKWISVGALISRNGQIGKGNVSVFSAVVTALTLHPWYNHFPHKHQCLFLDTNKVSGLLVLVVVAFFSPSVVAHAFVALKLTNGNRNAFMLLLKTVDFATIIIRVS